MHRRGPACHSFGSPVLAASFPTALPKGPLISWNGSTVLSEPLSHPSERRLRFRIGWLFLKISEDEQTWCLRSDVERQGKLASTPASPERALPHLSASAYLTGLMLTRLNIEKNATWPTKHKYQIQQVLYLRVRNKYRKLASRFFLCFVFRKAAGIMKVGDLDPIWKEKMKN